MNEEDFNNWFKNLSLSMKIKVYEMSKKVSPLAHTTRERCYRLILENPLKYNTKRLTAIFKLSYCNMYNHLKKLCESGLIQKKVVSTKKGREVVYEVSKK